MMQSLKSPVCESRPARRMRGLVIDRPGLLPDRNLPERQRSPAFWVTLEPARLRQQEHRKMARKGLPRHPTLFEPAGLSKTGSSNPGMAHGLRGCCPRNAAASRCFGRSISPGSSLRTSLPHLLQLAGQLRKIASSSGARHGEDLLLCPVIVICEVVDLFE